MVQYYGYCSNGHLHPILSKYNELAMNNSEEFESHMFDVTDIEEEKLPNETAFIPLEPTNCPNLEALLPFYQSKRPNKVPDVVKMAPFLLERGIVRTPKFSPVSYLMKFETQGDRLSETKADAKLKFYQLIKDAFPAWSNNQVEKMSYESLRQKFLREYWSINEQEKLYSKFKKCKYPMHRGQEVRDFVYYWLDLFVYDTAHLTRDIYENILKKIPKDYKKPLERFLTGGKLCDFYEALTDFETDKWPKKYKKHSYAVPPGDSESKLSACTKEVFTISVITSFITVAMGASWYYFISK